MTTINTNTTITIVSGPYAGETATTVSYAKGWWAVELNDQIIKLREKAMEVIDDQPRSSMSRKLEAAKVRYVTTIAPSGRKSKSNGDIVAQAFEGVELTELYAMMRDVAGMNLESRYAHLNAGSQRMNIGNRLRTLIKNGDVKAVAWVESAAGQ